MKKLPTGIQNFIEIRESDYAYVDKTGDIYKMINQGKYYFLSRPRRFGKSLLIDTISELFKGSKEYFKGLYIYDKWDWDTKYPVINISFGSGDFSSDETLNERINYIIEDNCDNLDIDYRKHNNLVRLIKGLYKKYGKKVVILVDEYDKPLLDVITDKPTAIQNRKTLKNLYSAIKDSDRYIKFVLLTGVSKFSKMNLFSGLNNLTDITIDPEYGTITGYTQNDLETVFKEHLEGVNMERVKRWYNGYNYFAAPIYNPFDILLFISKKYEFNNYWWGTGNPSFLIEKLKDSNFYIPNLEKLIVGEETLNSFDIEKIDLVALLWQTGYLTFDKKIISENQIGYKMKIPNIEVQKSLNALFLDYLASDRVEGISKWFQASENLTNRKLDEFATVLKSLFSAIPYNNYIKNIIANYEGYYSSVIYTFMAGLGFDIIGEDVTNKGRIDLTIKTSTTIYILEFKVDSKEEAIKQIKERRYYEKYQADSRDIYIIGINFDSTLRNISAYQWERVLVNYD